MAREAGMVYREFEDEFANANTDAVDLKTLEAFAALVREDEREIGFAKADLWIKRINDAVQAERTAMMQLFTDPENQPTQHGTVTVEYMQREIEAEREVIIEIVAIHGGSVEIEAAIRARGQTSCTHEWVDDTKDKPTWRCAKCNCEYTKGQL
jgi:ribosomal protein L20